jgi:hypothetical protein
LHSRNLLLPLLIFHLEPSIRGTARAVWGRMKILREAG